MSFFKKITELGPLPKYYGICYYKYNDRAYILAPIPLNFVLNILRRVLIKLKTSYRKDILYKAYIDGLNERKRINEIKMKLNR